MQASPLLKEIVVVLLVKVFLLTGLWAAFFGDRGNGAVTPERIDQVLIGRAEGNGNEVERGGADGR